MKKLLLVAALMMTAGLAVAHGPFVPPDPWDGGCAVLCFPWIFCPVPCSP